MRSQYTLLLALSLLLTACADPGAPPHAATPVTFDAAAPPEAKPELLSVSLGEGDLESPPPALDELQSGDTVWIALTLPVGQLPSVRRGDAWAPLSPDCAHGPVNGLDEISLPTGYNHMVVSVVPGRADQHAANLVACDYALATQPEPADVLPVRFRVTGCFMVQDVAIPTARQLIFQPRAAEACGL